jgi:hypothetical protein
VRFKLIACEVIFREISSCAARSEHVVDLAFLTKGLHDDPLEMTRILQQEIDDTSAAQDEAVALGYALCSRGTVGLRARDLPLVIPRAHDCISLFLGSRQAYAEYFRRQPGTYYFTTGWIERGGADTLRAPESYPGLGRSLQEYSEQYGEDNGRFLWEFENQWQQNYTTAAYIKMPLFDPPEVRAAAERAAAEYGWHVEELAGSERLFGALCSGQWNDEDFLIVPPGYEIAQAGDDTIVKVVPAQ